MQFAPGSRFGAYQVIDAIGRGGMGEVFRAHDSKLGRDVALKVLPAEFGADPELRQRLAREAKVLASLNHPNIAAIYGTVDVDGVLGLVLELVDGETLAERVDLGPMALAEAVNIAVQIASALEAAHNAGIVHRDLKPANVKVRPDGHVKVLDFGLAKEIGGAAGPGESTTVTRLATLPGAIVGTAAYMSPEQARGLSIDKRSDVWAFGCVLFEMLTGRRAFGGASTTDTLVAIMREEPAWSLLAEDTPSIVRRVLRRCLAKDPQERLRDLGDAQMDLRDALTPSTPADTRAPAFPKTRRVRRAAVAAAVATAIVTAGVAVWNMRDVPAPAAASISRLAITVPLESGPTRAGRQFALRAVRGLAISPDGKVVIFVGTSARADTSQLFVRRLDAYEIRPLPGTEGASAPFFSPDGQSVAFFANGKLRRTTVTGGAVSTICDAADDTSGGSGGTWNTDDIIVFAAPTSARAGLFRVSALGGTPETLVAPDPADEGGLGDPAFVPGSDWILFTTRQTKAGVAASIVVRSLRNGQQHKLALDRDSVSGLAAGPVAAPFSAPQYTTSGHVVFRRSNTLMAAEFHLDTGQTTGPTVTIADAAADFGMSAGGCLIYVVARSYGGQMVWVDRQGSVEPIDAPEDRFGRPRLSPNASQIAVEVMRGERSDVGVYRFASRALTLLTTNGGSNSPVWHPDGRRVVFRASAGLVSQSIETTRPPESFLTSSDPALRSASDVAPGVFSRLDPSVFTFALHGSAATGADIFRLHLGPPRRVETFVQRPGNQWAVRVSPDGKWIAYASDESGRFEIYVQSVVADGGRYQASVGGGSEAVWAPAGNELFYWEGDRFMTVPIDLKAADTPVGTPRSLFSGRFQHSDLPQYDVMPDGRRFVMIRPNVDELEARTIRIVDGWVPEFNERVPRSR